MKRWLEAGAVPVQSQARLGYSSAMGTWGEQLGPPQLEAHQGHGVEVGEPLLLPRGDGQQGAQRLQLHVDLVPAGLGGTLG